MQSMTICKYLFAILLLCTTTCRAAAQEPRTRAEIEQVVADLWEARAYKDLDNLQTKLKGKLTLSGFSLLEMFYQAVEQQVESDSIEPMTWQLKEEVALGWTKAMPTSALAHVTYANVHRYHGYAIRGTKYASQVSPAQWQGFREYTAKAKIYLLENRQVASSIPAWHEAMLNIAKVSGSKLEFRELMYVALEQFPGYLGLYVVGVARYTPKWGGAPGEAAAFISEVTAQLPEPANVEIYARLYNMVYQSQPDVDARQFADCSKWLRGVGNIVENFSTPYNINQAAVASYVCNDHSLARAYFAQIGDVPQPGVWGSRESALSEFRRAREWALSTAK